MHFYSQRQPTRGVLRKSCSENIKQIHISHGCSPVNLLDIFRASFPKSTSARLLLYSLIIDNYDKISDHYISVFGIHKEYSMLLLFLYKKKLVNKQNSIFSCVSFLVFNFPKLKHRTIRKRSAKKVNLNRQNHWWKTKSVRRDNDKLQKGSFQIVSCSFAVKANRWCSEQNFLRQLYF